MNHFANLQPNILIPMAGLGSRFVEAGFYTPKPMINVKGKPMVQASVESLNLVGRYIYVVQKAHYDQYDLRTFLQKITPSCEVLQVDGTTEGTVATTLVARSLINTDNPLIIANCDQILDWDSKDFMASNKEDGLIVVFNSSDAKWSYASVSDAGLVERVAEKEVISEYATAGVYYWKKGSDYIKYADQMIAKNIRTNNEFYVCPVYNEALLDKKKIVTYPINQLWGVGTPEDLNLYLAKD
jgi:NDP-sugar pyrophosphorylase family protein